MKVALLFVLLGVALIIVSATPHRGGGIGSSEEVSGTGAGTDYSSGNQRRGHKRRGSKGQPDSSEEQGTASVDYQVSGGSYGDPSAYDTETVAAQSGRKTQQRNRNRGKNQQQQTQRNKGQKQQNSGMSGRVQQGNKGNRNAGKSSQTPKSQKKPQNV